MRKLFLIISAMAVLAGCSENKVEKTPDAISVAPEEKYFSKAGGVVSVVVNSTGDWTLGTDGEKYDWVSADKTSGKDGETVRFTVEPNDSEEKTAVFIFTEEQSSAKFTVVSSPETYTVKVISESNVESDYKAGKLQVSLELSDNIDYHDLEYSIEQNGEWITHAATIDGDAVNTARMDFDYSENGSLEMRVAKIQIFYKSSEPVTVAFSQNSRPTLALPQMTYNLSPEAGTLEIPVSANVEYEMTMGEGSEWLTGYTVENDLHKWTYDALSEGKRQAMITFTEKNPSDPENPLSVTAMVFQSNSIINTAPYMKGHRAVFAENCRNMDILKLGKNFTVEMLVKHDNEFEDGIGSMFGIEERFLLRHGNGGFNPAEWELSYATYPEGGYLWSESVEAGRLPGNEWIHLTVTVQCDEEGNGKIILYQNGEEYGNEGFWGPDFLDVDLGMTYAGGNNVRQKFALGWSYDDTRDFKGQMSEVRVWNRVLTIDEIKADGHFYSVPADSEGLVAYWKLNEGQGVRFKDSTGNGNDLIGEVYDSESGTWSEGVEWQDVELQ